MNAVQAPALSVLNLVAKTSAGPAVAVPIVGGIAARRRDLRIGGVAVLTLLLSVVVLFLGDGVSPLVSMVEFGLIALPGARFGWWLGGESRSITLRR